MTAIFIVNLANEKKPRIFFRAFLESKSVFGTASLFSFVIHYDLISIMGEDEFVIMVPTKFFVESIEFLHVFIESVRVRHNVYYLMLESNIFRWGCKRVALTHPHLDHHRHPR
tara:strand:- start:389 stop:727 length:339 start_codon:yes stop_codon:yes gene_type:complete